MSEEASKKFARIRALARRAALRIRRADTGPFFGATTSLFKGRGLAFEELRPYQPGDDPRDLAPKATAKTGIPHIKRHRLEREKTVWLLVDAGPRMQFQGCGQRKSDAAYELIAGLSYLAAFQRDRVGLARFGDQPDGERAIIAPVKGARELGRILQPMPNQPFCPLTNVVGWLARLTKQRGQVVLVTDFAREPNLGQVRPILAKRSALAIVLVDPWELDLPRLGLVRWRDLASGRTQIIDTDHEPYRSVFREQAKLRRRSWQQAGAKAGVRVVFVGVDRDVTRSLFLQLRGHRP